MYKQIGRASRLKVTLSITLVKNKPLESKRCLKWLCYVNRSEHSGTLTPRSSPFPFPPYFPQPFKNMRVP